MSWLKVILVVAAAVWLQFFLSAARPFGVVPSLVPAAVIGLSLYRPASQATLMALVMGLVLDLQSGSDFGLRTGFYVTLALLVALLLQIGIELERSLAQALMAATAGAVLTLIIVGIVMVGGGRAALGEVGRLIAISAVIDFGLMLALARPLGWWLRPSRPQLQIKGL